MSHKYVSNKAVMKNEGFLAKLGSTLMSRTNPDPLIETKTQSSISWRKTSDVKARIKTATGTIPIYEDMSPEEIAELQEQATLAAGGLAPDVSGPAATAIQTACLAAGLGQEEQETTTVATYLVNEDYSPDDSEGLAVVAGQKVTLVDKSSPHKRPRLEGDEDSTQLLDNAAARHKMAVRPKRNHPDPRSRAQEASEERWVVRDPESGKEGLVPSRLLALHTQETTTSLKASLKRSVQQLAMEETLTVKKNLMKEIREFKSRKLSSKLLGPSPEDEARAKRTATIRELIETEEEFVKDLEFVMENYYNLMEKSTTPRNIRDHKELIFNNFKFISDFHQNVLIEGVKYHSEVPTMIGRTFLRLERDFDKHAEYCSNEPLAQEFLDNNIPVKEYFEEYSQRIGDDKRLQEHLKLPIQRLNDYQLLLRELVKYSSRLGDDTTDLQRAYDLMQTIPQRATDAKFITSIEGFKGNLFKLGRLIRHDWFSVKEAGQKARDRYLFLFKARILITKVKRIGEDRSVFILKDIIRLPETSLGSLDNPRALEFFHIESLTHPNYPIHIEARTPEIRDSWLAGIEEYVVDTASVEDLLFDDELRVVSQDIDEEDAGVVSPVPEVQEFEDLPEDEELFEQLTKESQKVLEREPSPPAKRQKPETKPLEEHTEGRTGEAKGSQQPSSQLKPQEATGSPGVPEQQTKGGTLEQVEALQSSIEAEQKQAPTATTTESPPTTTTPKQTQLADQQDLAGGLLKADDSIVSEARLTDPTACVVKSEKVYPMEVAEAEIRGKENVKDDVKGGIKGLGFFHGGFAGSATGQRRSEVQRGNWKSGEKGDRLLKDETQKLELTERDEKATLENLEKSKVLKTFTDSPSQSRELPEDTDAKKKVNEIQWEEEVDFWSQWEQPLTTVQPVSEVCPQSDCDTQCKQKLHEIELPGGAEDSSVEMRQVDTIQDRAWEEDRSLSGEMRPTGLEATATKLETDTKQDTDVRMNVEEDVADKACDKKEENFDFWADRETSPPISRPTFSFGYMAMGETTKPEENINERSEGINNTNESKTDKDGNSNTQDKAPGEVKTETPKRDKKLKNKQSSAKSCIRDTDLLKVNKRGKARSLSPRGSLESAKMQDTDEARGTLTDPEELPLTTSTTALEAGSKNRKFASRVLKEKEKPHCGGNIAEERDSDPLRTQAASKRQEGAPTEVQENNSPSAVTDAGPSQVSQAPPGNNPGTVESEKKNNVNDRETFDDDGFWIGPELSPPLRRKPVLTIPDSQEFNASVGEVDVTDGKMTNSREEINTKSRNNVNDKKGDEEKAGRRIKEETKMEKSGDFWSMKDESLSLLTAAREAVEAARRQRGEPPRIEVTGEAKENTIKEKEMDSLKRGGGKGENNEDSKYSLTQPGDTNNTLDLTPMSDTAVLSAEVRETANSQKNATNCKKSEIKRGLPAREEDSVTKNVEKVGWSIRKLETQRLQSLKAESLVENSDEIDSLAVKRHLTVGSGQPVVQPDVAPGPEVNQQLSINSTERSKVSGDKTGSWSQPKDQSVSHSNIKVSNPEVKNMAQKTHSGSTLAKGSGRKLTYTQRRALLATLQAENKEIKSNVDVKMNEINVSGGRDVDSPSSGFGVLSDVKDTCDLPDQETRDASEQAKPSEGTAKSVVQEESLAKNGKETLGGKDKQKDLTKKKSVEPQQHTLNSCLEVDQHSGAVEDDTLATPQRLNEESKPYKKIENEGGDWIAMFLGEKEISSPPRHRKSLFIVVEDELENSLRKKDAGGSQSCIPPKEENQSRSESTFPSSEGNPKESENNLESTVKRGENIEREGMTVKDSKAEEVQVALSDPASNQTKVAVISNTNSKEMKSLEEIDLWGDRVETSTISSRKTSKQEDSIIRPCDKGKSDPQPTSTTVCPSKSLHNSIKSPGKVFSADSRRDSVSRPRLTYEALDLPVMQRYSTQGLQASRSKDITGSLPSLALTADAEKVMQKYRRFRVQLPPDNEEKDENLDVWFDSDVRQPSPVRVICFFGQMVDPSSKAHCGNISRRVAFCDSRSNARPRTKSGRSRSTPARSVHGWYSWTTGRSSHLGVEAARAAKSTTDIQKEAELQRSGIGSMNKRYEGWDPARRVIPGTGSDLPVLESTRDVSLRDASSAEGKTESVSEMQQRMKAKGVKKSSLPLVSRDSAPRLKGGTEKGKELVPTPLPSKRPRRTRVMMI